MSARIAILLSAFLLASTAHAQTKPHPVGTLAPTAVKDLYYGDVLFYYYQDDYFEALTRLLAAREKDRVSHHAEEAELLLGGLYLSYGQHVEAGRIFQKLLAGKVAPSVRDRAWFYLGKVWYQRGYWVESERALREAGKRGPTEQDKKNRDNRPMSAALEAERRNLLAMVLINQGRYEEAIADLRNATGPADWTAYGQFNLGVALVRANRLPEAAEMLNAVGLLETTKDEMLALKDRANVALGYAYLQAGKPADAKPVLQRVRLQGPESNKALLALGWAESAEEHYQEALVPWMELHGRNLLDAAVQESYLAIPYAFARLKADAQAVEHYTAAVQSYSAEVDRIDESIAAIRAGRMLETIVEQEKKDSARKDADQRKQGWFWQLENLPDAPESSYLYHLLAGHEFQEGLKNYRDLRFMSGNVEKWAGNVEVFGHMLDTRREAYQQRLPKVDEVLARDDPDRLAGLRVDLESRVNAAEGSGDFVALGTAQEQQMWARIAELEQNADALDDEARDKVRLLKGVLYWQLNKDFKARAWSTHRNLKELDQAMREMQKRWIRVEKARSGSPDDTGTFAKRVDALEPRMAVLQGRLAAAGRAQGEYLGAMAIEELERQKQRLIDYQLQARYALATIYDRASDDSGAKKEGNQ